MFDNLMFLFWYCDAIELSKSAWEKMAKKNYLKLDFVNLNNMNNQV